MVKSYWLLLRKYCLQTTIDGLKYFYLYPDLLSRCFWMLNMVTLTVLSFTITYLLYWRFDQMPTHVTIETQFEPILNLPYPTITLCPSNQMTKSSVEFFNRSLVDGNLTIDLKSTLPTLLGFYELFDNINEYDLDKLQKSFDLNRFTIPEVMGRIPLSCERFLKQCFLEGELHDCKTLFKPILTVHGYCCSFNSKYYFNGKRVTVDRDFKIRKISATSFSSFFSVISDYEPEEAFVSTILNTGSIRVMLTDWTEYPFDYESYLVDTNAESFLFLRATYTYCSSDVQLLPVLSRECLLDDERKLPFFWYYHDSDCELMCQVLAVKDSCDCWPFFLPFLGIDNTCKVTHIPCIMNVKKNMYLWLNSEQCHCPRNCVSRKYHADVTVGNFRALPYMINSPSLLSALNFNKSTSLMNFLFTKHVYTKLKQETVLPLVFLFSNVGGIFGMFLGCSTLSVFEIFFFLYRGIRHYYYL